MPITKVDPIYLGNFKYKKLPETANIRIVINSIT